MRALRTASMITALLIAASFHQARSAANLFRPYEPVVVVANQLPLYSGAPIQEIFVYGYVNGSWKQLAFQIDEKKNGSFLNSGNNILDGSDEICFMAVDMGDSAADHQWIADAASMVHQRYQIKAINISTEPKKVAYAYIYRSSSLTLDPAVTAYMQYVAAPPGAANDTIKARGYVLGHNTNAIADHLSLRNGTGKSADLLDRWKIRYSGMFFGNPTLIYDDTEDTALTDSVLTHKSGRIRTFRRIDFSCRLRTFSISPLSQYSIFYPYHVTTTMMQDTLKQVYGIDTLRQSFDLSDKAKNAKFYNRFNSNITIDGASDAVIKTFSDIELNWQLIQGSVGSVVSYIDSLNIGSVKEIYYRDDNTLTDPHDTGDGASYGDTGTLIANTITKLSGSFRSKQITFFLGGYHTTLPLVDSLVTQRNQPLQLSVSARTYIIPVELASFSGLVAEDVVKLSWQTTSESQNYGFEVQRQMVSGAMWETLAFVKGGGTTNESISYGYEDRPSKSGNYRYRLNQIDFDGSNAYSPVLSITLAAPSQLTLSQNFPNPFNPDTEIRFQIPVGSSRRVVLNVYNLLGQQVKALLHGTFEPGFYRAVWDGTDGNGFTTAGGVYFFSLQTDQERVLRKAIKMQ